MVHGHYETMSKYAQLLPIQSQDYEQRTNAHWLEQMIKCIIGYMLYVPTLILSIVAQVRIVSFFQRLMHMTSECIMFFREEQNDNVPIPLWSTTCKLFLMNSHAINPDGPINVAIAYMLAFFLATGSTILQICGSSFSTIGIIGIVTLLIDKLINAMGLAASKRIEQSARKKADEDRKKADEKIELLSQKFDGLIAIMKSNNIRIDDDEVNRCMIQLSQDMKREAISELVSRYVLEEQYNPLDHLTPLERRPSAKLSGSE